MHDELNNKEASKNSKFSKVVPSIIIADPIEVFRLDSLQRPPSVPVLCRKISSESIMNPIDEKGVQFTSNTAFKKHRRKSIPDRLDHKPNPTHRKSESKLKFIQKQSDLKPHMNKSGKIPKIKSAKLMQKKSNISTPHLKKMKKVTQKGFFVIPDVSSTTPDKLKSIQNIQGRMSKRCLDKKDGEEARKSSRENYVRINCDGKLKDDIRKDYKSSKSALSNRAEDKVRKELRKVKKDKIAIIKTDETPLKKRPPKKTEKCEKSNSHSVIARGKIRDDPQKKQAFDNKKLRKKSSEKKSRSKAKAPEIPSKKAEKKTKSHSKKRLLKHYEGDQQWLEHSFFVKSKRDDNSIIENNSRFPDASSVERLNENNLFGSENYSSYDNNLFNINLSGVPNEEVINKNASCPVGSLIPLSRKETSRNLTQESDEILIIDNSRLKNRFKLKQKPPRSEDHARRIRAAIKIQKVFRGYIVRKQKPQIRCEEVSNSEIFEIEFDDLSSEDEEVKQIIGELQNSPPYINSASSPQEISLPSNPSQQTKSSTHSSSPKPPAPRALSPITTGVHLDVSEIAKRLRQEQKNYELLEKDCKSLKSLPPAFKSSIEDLRNQDIESIKKLSPETNSESEILGLFQNIINRRYEKINSMFNDNIRAVQEALAESVLSEDSSVLSSIDLNKFSLLHQDDSIKTKSEGIKHFTPEPFETTIGFCLNPRPIPRVYEDIEPEKPVFKNLTQEKNSSKIVWVDEVAMPTTVDFTDLIIESAISESFLIIFDHIFEEFFKISSNFISALSEELIIAILMNEIKDQSDEMRRDLDESSILRILHDIYGKTHYIIVEELKKPLEKDPLMVLTEIQETEVGTGFLPDEKYLMLNSEAFADVISHSSKPVKIFNQAVFDCINESLEKIIYKEELPWTDKRNYRQKLDSSEDVLNYIENRLIVMNEIKAGEIFCGVFDESSRPTEEKVNLIRENGLVRMLAHDVYENNEEWKNYEKEETQSKLDTADMILEQEIEIAIEILINC